MNSLIDRLRAMLGLKMGSRGTGNQGTRVMRIGAFHTLSKRMLACEDDALKEQLWNQMCAALPDTLFLAAMCYDGDNPNAPIRDKVLHVTVGAKRLYPENQHIINRGNPGYRPSKKADNRRIHLRTLVYQKSKEEWIPLFTDFYRFREVFGKTSRVTVISYAEASEIAKPYQGIVVNPGKNAIRLENVKG